MFTKKQLDTAYEDAALLASKKVDTFTFRMGFQQDVAPKDQEQILVYLQQRLQLGDPLYTALKGQIDRQEFLSTDYYANPYPRRFRGAYGPVVRKTFAGLMSLTLV